MEPTSVVDKKCKYDERDRRPVWSFPSGITIFVFQWRVTAYLNMCSTWTHSTCDTHVGPECKSAVKIY